MSDLTPVKIRGKRNRQPEEKWHHGKKRNAVEKGMPTFLERDPDSQSTVAGSIRAGRKRRHHNVELSQLEQLPTEVVQLIFKYAANVDMALASPRLASQLSNAHLFREITDSVLEPIIQKKVSKQSEHGATVARLMNSRFFTWPFFQDWLEHQVKMDKSLLDLPENINLEIHDTESVTRYQMIWRHATYQVESSTLPPPKLYSMPFTKNSLDFLNVLMPGSMSLGVDPGPSYLQKVKLAIRQAIAQGMGDMVECCVCGFFNFLTLDESYLRIAVVEGGCDTEIIETLLRNMLWSEKAAQVNWLDPDIWAWAAKASKEGDKKGAWLRQLLRQISQLSYEKELSTDEGHRYTMRQEWHRIWNETLVLLD